MEKIKLLLETAYIKIKDVEQRNEELAKQHKDSMIVNFMIKPNFEEHDALIEGFKS